MDALFSDDAAVSTRSFDSPPEDVASRATMSQDSAEETRHEAGQALVPDMVSRVPVFLKAYLAYLSGTESTSYHHDVAEFCACNDPGWTNAVQRLALQCYAGMLDPGTMPVSGTARQHALMVNAHPISCEMRKTWLTSLQRGGLTQHDAVARSPQFTISSTHFVFRIGSDTTRSAGEDSTSNLHFSAQVRVVNNGKHSWPLVIHSHLRGEDEHLRSALGKPPAEASPAGIVYQVLTDHEGDPMQRGECSTLVLSMTVTPSADFGVAYFVLQLNIGGPLVHTPVFCSLTLINPHGLVFGVPVPYSCTTTVQNPLGTYKVPAVLAGLFSIYFARNGPTSTSRGALIADSSEDVAAVHAARAVLDDDGHKPFLVALRTDALPPTLAQLSPPQLLSSALLWLCEYPRPILPIDIASSDDPMRFLDESIPSESHGIVLSVIDACCKILVAREQDQPCLPLLVALFAHAMMTASLNLIFASRSTAEQMQNAAECLRSAASHVEAWIQAFTPRYRSARQRNTPIPVLLNDAHP